MSQQGPGGYGGGGPYGPPGGYGGQPPGGGYPPGGGGYPPGGGPPGGGAPPGGYGPPGYPPPGGPPPGYGPPQPGYGGYPGAPPAGPGGPPPKKGKTLLWVGLGCGGLLLLSIGGGIAGYQFMRSQVSAVESAVAAASAAVAGETTGGAPVTLTPSCGKAVACCKATMAKTAGPNAAAAEQACNGVGLLSDDICAKQYEAYKRAATVVGVTCP